MQLFRMVQRRRGRISSRSTLVGVTPSPRIGQHGWGFVEVEGLGRLRDAKLWPGGGRAWERHVHGLLRGHRV